MCQPKAFFLENTMYTCNDILKLKNVKLIRLCFVLRGFFANHKLTSDRFRHNRYLKMSNRTVHIKRSFNRIFLKNIAFDGLAL